MKRKLVIVILAAGQGVRMKSELPKVLHSVCGKPLINWSLDLAKSLRPNKIIVVLGHKSEAVKKALDKGINVVLQNKPLGTADAIKKVLPRVDKSADLLVLYADIPLLETKTLKNLLKCHRDSDSQATILTVRLDNPFGYGRIIRDNFSRIKEIIEEKDATSLEREIKEINTGIFCFKVNSLAKFISKIKADNAKKEFYLTDIIKLFYENSLKTESLEAENPNEILGINSQKDLVNACNLMRFKIMDRFIEEGVRIIDPQTTYIDEGASILGSTVIYPFTIIEKDVKIGKYCQIGPFCHLRSGTKIEDNVIFGNFVEAVRTNIGAGTLMKHFGYLGDTSIGKNVNLGAGMVVANFDGKNKNKTVIGDNAFVGSDAVLVAPVKIGKASVIGAGAVVTKNVNPKTTVVGIP
ncbi:MAG: NTP transferase domain-containing protein, partial [Candidatus Omnitrophota bacterium]